MKHKKEVRRKAAILMIQNFFIWFIPGAVVLALSLIIMLILMAAAAQGVETNFFKWAPKGLISYLGIAYGICGIAFAIIPIVIMDIDSESIFYLIAMAVLCLILGYIIIRREMKRLSALV